MKAVTVEELRNVDAGGGTLATGTAARDWFKILGWTSMQKASGKYAAYCPRHRIGTVTNSYREYLGFCIIHKLCWG